MSQTKTDKPKGAIVADPELAAMNRLAKILDALPGESRERVLWWISLRYRLGLVRMQDAKPQEPAHADH